MFLVSLAFFSHALFPVPPFVPLSRLLSPSIHVNDQSRPWSKSCHGDFDYWKCRIHSYFTEQTLMFTLQARTDPSPIRNTF